MIYSSPILHCDSLTRFIIITVPPLPISLELQTLITECSALGDTHEARSYPPHITLRTGALVPKDEVSAFITGFKKHCENLSQVEITSLEIQCESYQKDGEQKFFIGYDINKTKQLSALHQELLKYDAFIKGKQSTFNPHLSIAYSDLTEENFVKLKNHIAKNQAAYARVFSWNADNVSLYVKDNDTWKPYYVHQLQ